MQNPSEEIEVVNSAGPERETGAGAKVPAPAAPDDFDEDDELADAPEPERTAKASPGAAEPNGTSAEPPPPSSPPELPAPPPPARRVSRVVRNLALKHGLTPEQIAGADPDYLEDWVEYAEASASRQQRQPEPAAAEPDVDLGINEAEYDPGLVSAMKRIARGRDEKIRALEEKLAASEQREQSRRARGTAEAIDDAFESLGAAYERQLGKGGVADIQNNSPEHKRRMAVLVSAGIDFNDPPAPAVLRRKVREAAELLFGESGKQPPPAPEPQKPVPPKDPINGRFVGAADAEELARRQAWVSAGLAPPTQRNGAPEPKGVRRATKVLGAKLREQFDPEDDEENDL